MINRRLKKSIASAILLCFTSLTGAQPLYAVPANTQLPTGPNGGYNPTTHVGNVNTPVVVNDGSVMNIHQTTQTAVNEWGNFSIGADATVNFSGPEKFNSFNYVKNGGPISEIYGQLNATNNGNIFIANPAGVQIGNSAQINVGSLYVTNKAFDAEKIKEQLKADSSTGDIASYIAGIAPNTNPAAELMSLGSITSATNVTFDGGRIVLDVDRFFTEEDGGGKVQMTPEQLKGAGGEAGSLVIKTNDKDNVVLGYTGYVENEPGEANYSKKNTFDSFKVTVTGVGEDGKATETQDTIEHGYMWVEDLDQLQKIADTDNLSGWYALRNSIDANYTASDSYNSGFDNGTTGLGFKPIGTYKQKWDNGLVSDYSEAFAGRFDGLGYSIFGLNIKRENEKGVGLFGAVHGDNAVVRNLILNGGSIAGGNNVGSVAGLVDGGARIEKITNTADVSGNENVGGIAGALESKDGDVTSVTDLVNIGKVSGHRYVGGIIGSATGIKLGGTVYNLGGVAGVADVFGADSLNVGGLIGIAQKSEIGDGKSQIYNRANVTGGYNVGGIVGAINDADTGSTTPDIKFSTVTNAANYGDVTATGSKTEEYLYHTLVTNENELPPGTEFKNKTQKLASVNVKVANAGGIVGSSVGIGDDEATKVTLENVRNTGDVKTSSTKTMYEYTIKADDGTESTGTARIDQYQAGNVGGIVGSATHTNITNAENSENKISGAHNVGGIAGYLEAGTVSNSGNDGGEITATGARNDDGNDFVQEYISKPDGKSENFYIGNIGGIVGYLFGDKAKIENSGNRGNVHSALIEENATTMPKEARAANAGGVVGKAGVGAQHHLNSDSEKDITGIKDDTNKATISGSYNTGDVQGYTGVGGVAGLMYQGSIAGSYNYGAMSSTRTAGNADNREPLNLGGIVGDTTDISGGAGTVIYDVYNAGQIGDETFTYYGRHVGGIAGRLSGDIEKAYNTGDIYNGYSVVGGIAGWWHGGSIKNVFNTGNITVLNRDTGNQYSEVGGIVGASGASASGLSYAYNLGTLRSIKGKELLNSNNGYSAVGGIIGRVRTPNLTISNVYTTNNIYAGVEDGKGDIIKDNGDDLAIGAIYATIDTGAPSHGSVTITDAYLVELYESEAFDFSKFNKDGVESTTIPLENAKQQNSYQGFFNEQNIGWRIYKDKTLPILNAFTPYAASKENKWNTGNWSVQYGTAANPLLTIINANGDVTLDWDSLNISGAGSIAVYGNESLTINGFNVELGSHYNGTVYSDGALTITTGGAEGALYNLGSGSRLYGSSVTFDAGDRDAGLYGKITATDGGIDIKGKNVTVLGELSTPVQPEDEQDFTTTVHGIAQEDNAIDGLDLTTLNNLNTALPTVEQANAVEKETESFFGGIKIFASGVAEVLFGSMGGGKITSGGDLSVTGDQGIFVDSDFHIAGDMNLTSSVTNDDGTVTGGEVVLDLSNMGKTSSGESESDVEHMHKYFLDHFKKNEDGQNAGTITVDVANDEDFIIGLDMWDESKDTFDFTKYDVKNQGDDHTLYEDIENLNLTIKVNGEEGEHSSYRNHVFTWIESAAQLKAVQESAGNKLDNDEGVLSFNFALKDDIDASQLTGYKPIAANDGKEYNGIFDGRGFRIIGLNANLHDDGTERVENDAHSRAGIFGTIGENGKVRDLSVYTSKFTGKAAAGAIAGVNKGEIKDVITFGNEVKVLGTQEAVKVAAGKNDTATGDISISAAGGVAGVNLGAITGSDRTDASGIGSTHASDTVIAGGSAEGIYSAAGGVAGVNVREDKETVEGKGLIEKVSSTSAVRSNNIDNNGATKTHGLGGVAGINDGTITGAEAHGTTNTLFGLRAGGTAWDANVGGVAGVNYGALDGVYNESAVAGKTNVGGVAGKNEIRGETQATIENAVNAGPVFSRGGTDGENTGGIAGANYGSIAGGRNTDEITGNKNVGGVVGLNAFGALLQNISNAIAAEIRGNDAVGGIAGSNAANLTENYNLVNEGLIEGNANVGGIAGINETTGVIDGAVASDVVADIVINSGSITGVENVGGIAGTNKGTIKGRAEEGTARSANLGSISGNKNVGGIAGVNEEGATIENTNTDVTLTATGNNPTNFGGVAGTNKGKITNATNRGTITAYGAQNVGGIAGVNEMGDGGTGGLLENAGNEGTVIGGSHVAGVVAINKSDKADGTIKNSGTVIATDGGAAGIIYENIADLGGEGKTLKLINSGTVVGFSQNKDHGTGGVIGNNSGTITNASLISTVASTVTGGWNTGGLIGYNKGTIKGGRAANETNGLGYYAYKIYNNGEVTGTQNVGGLIGNNAAGGTLKAGYNTGRVTGMTADESTFDITGITLPEDVKMPEGTELKDTLSGEGKNIGGIAGTNAGLLDQIFNFVMMNDEEGNKVSGVSNTGGVVGSNEQGGELTNAYNATAVKVTGDGGVKGNAVGLNEGTITNVYATNTNGKLIGSSNGGTATNAYTFIADDTAQGAKVVSGDGQKQAASYDGFDFTGKNGEAAIWKIYEGYGTPLLKVFLTEAKYGGETGIMQTGRPVGLPISGVTAGDGLAAYRADNSLLVALKNAGVGDGYLAFMSRQIAWSGVDETFNPNWLGYDIDATYDITPNPALLLTQNNGHLHWLHRGGDRNRNFRERKAEIYFHEGGMVHE